jgi:hypothetical protein
MRKGSKSAAQLTCADAAPVLFPLRFCRGARGAPNTSPLFLRREFSAATLAAPFLRREFLAATAAAGFSRLKFASATVALAFLSREFPAATLAATFSRLKFARATVALTNLRRDFPRATLAAGFLRRQKSLESCEARRFERIFGCSDPILEVAAMRERQRLGRRDAQAGPVHISILSQRPRAIAVDAESAASAANAAVHLPCRRAAVVHHRALRELPLRA